MINLKLYKFIILFVSIVMIIFLWNDQVLFWEIAGNLGNRYAQHKTAFAYLHGGGGANPDYYRARIWLEKAANNGDVQAIGWLAWMIETGRGGAKNEKEALMWYQKAAGKGDIDSQKFLKNRGINW